MDDLYGLNEEEIKEPEKAKEPPQAPQKTEMSPLEAIFDLFLTRYVAERNPTENTLLTVNSILPRFLAFIETARNRTNLDEVDGEDVLAYLNAMNTRTSTKKTHKAIITLFLNAAYSYGLLSRKPETVHFRGPADIPRAPIKGWTLDEMAQMKRKAARLSEREKILFGLLSKRPLRVGELVRLKVGDIDLDSRTLTIYRSKNTKTRVISIPHEIFFCLKALMGDRPKEEHLFGVGLRMMEWMINEMILKLGIKRQGRSSHAFRHFCIMSMLRDARIDPAVVAQVAGNSPRTIYAHYNGQVSVDEQRKAERTFDQVKERG